MDENKKKYCDSFEENNAPEFCDVMEAQPQLLKVLRKDLDVSSNTVAAGVSAPLIGLSWPSSSWADGSHRSAFQPYRPSAATCNNTILTNLQRGNTETETPKQGYSEFTWHQKAGRGDIATCDIPSDFFINRLDSEGLTALMWASSYGQYSSVQLLLNAGASVNTQGLKGETSLLLCSSEGHLDILRLLIANGAKVNHTDKAGNTPLIYASFNNHHHCAHELLVNGADVTLKNNLGVSAYSAAVGRKNNLVAAVIEKYILSLFEEEEVTQTNNS